MRAEFDQHLLCDGSCRYRCHRPARGVWSPRPEVLEAFARGRWRGNWSDGTHGEGLTNEWCPSRHKADGAPQHRILFFGRAALHDCLRGRHLVFVGDSSMRIFFSAVVSMVNGTREWDTPDPALSSWRLPLETVERRATTCDYRRDNEHNVELPCFREYAGHGARLTYVWKTFVRDRPAPGRFQMPNETVPSLSFSDVVVSGFLTRSRPPDLLVVEAGIWDRFADAGADEPGGPPLTLARQLAEWIGGLRARFDGAIVFAQPTNSPPEYDRVIRGLGLPVVWRKPSNRPKPSGFPPANDRGAHSNDVCAIEHANMLLSSLCT